MADNNVRNAGGYVTPFTSTEAFSMANFNNRIEEINEHIGIVTGTYTGTGVEQELNLGFTPTLFMVWGVPIVETTYNTDTMGCICFPGSDALIFQRGGNNVFAKNTFIFTSTGVVLPSSNWSNRADNTYYYAAFRG